MKYVQPKYEFVKVPTEDIVMGSNIVTSAGNPCNLKNYDNKSKTTQRIAVARRVK